MFEQTFKNIDDILHKDAGCTSELDYTEQSSWLLFLKYLDSLEQDRASEAKLDGKTYSFILDKAYRWEKWAAPKGKDGKLDHNAAMTGDDLRDFVNQKLFPYLAGFKQRASGPNTIEYKIGEVFGEIKNKIQSGYNLRDVIDLVDELRFGSQNEKHELSHLYEAKIRNMGNAGRNGGEYYTPRPLIRAMIKVIDPKIGERIYDGACGSAGFLCEAYDYLLPKAGKASDLKTLQTKMFYGKEKKSLAYVIAIMNMILHGIEAPNVVHTNTLGENINDIQDRDRYDVILANPPFGGKERKEVQQNFPIKTGETAFLFLQHFIKALKAGGRAAIVIKNTFLSNTDNASISLRKLLLESCNLHTVLDCPGGTFQGAGVKTVVLFFEKGAPTREVWFYQLTPGRNLGKSVPLNDDDLIDFVARAPNATSSRHSWHVNVSELDPQTLELTPRNPNDRSAIRKPRPEDCVDLLRKIDADALASEERISALLGPYLRAVADAGTAGWAKKQIGEIADHSLGKMLDKAKNRGEFRPYLRNLNVRWFEFDLSDLLEMRFTAEESDKYSVRKGDVLVCEGGYPGRAAIWHLEEPMFFQKALHRVRFEDPLHAKWFVNYLYFMDATGQLKQHFTGAGIQHFTGEALARFSLPLPPSEEMKVLLESFDGLSELVGALDLLGRQKAAVVDDLRIALLQTAFRPS